jgi:uncharacterized protein (TIGR02646 family)
MIKVRRGPEPTILTRKKSAWTMALQNATTKKQESRAESKYQHQAIKEALIKMFHGKCAYCESKIIHIDYGHIEHFRPKSLAQFRCLTFDWNNLFLACAKCNGPDWKADNFPEQNAGGPPINPCDDSPEEHLAFFFDLKGRVATVSYKTERGRISIDLFGLNRQDLRSHRSKMIEKLLVLSRIAAVDQEAAALVLQSQNDDEEYAAFSRELAGTGGPLLKKLKIRVPYV